VREIADSLDCSFEIAVLYFIEQQSENNRRRECKNEVVEADKERVTDQAPEVITSKEIFEVIQADPRASEVAQLGIKALKRHHDAEHWYVAESYEIRNDRQRQQIDLPVHTEISSNCFPSHNLPPCSVPRNCSSP